MNCLGAYCFTMAERSFVNQYAPKQFLLNYHELCNLVVFIIAWKCEQWFTKGLVAIVKQYAPKQFISNNG